MSNMLTAISRHIAEATGRPFRPRDSRALGGGCINSAMVLESDDRKYFVKANAPDQLDMFAAEADGLAELAAAQAVRVPQPICFGAASDAAYLVLEYIDFGDGVAAAAQLGRELAQQHRRTAPTFGWHRDNTIGSTPQINTSSASWVDFWRTQRLGFQLDLAARRHGSRALQQNGQRLLERLDAFFGHYAPVPSLLHGDLWGGNHGATRDGEPVIFDPAVYYGDREADIAMTELFGGFGARFYAAYREAWPLDDGYGVRKTLYNLYHVLNHFNLFGGGYGAQAQRMIDSLLAEIR
jgi:fructosamine-3-kinase